MSWFRLLVLMGVMAIEGAGVVTRLAQAQDPVRLSVSTTGQQANGDSNLPHVSATGRFVAFCSSASNLVPNDTNTVMDVFLHDRDVDADGDFDEPGAIATVRISERNGVQANDRCWSGPKVTPDGRYVVFGSRATNLVDTFVPRNTEQIYRADRLTGEIVLVSRSQTGEPANQSASTPAISDDGRFVAFSTSAYNLEPGDLAGGSGVFLRDLTANTLFRLSEPQDDWNGVDTGTYAFSVPSMSPDGSLILFSESRTIYVQGKEQRTVGVTLFNRVTGEIRRRFAPGNAVMLTRDGTAFIANSSYGNSNTDAPIYSQHIATGERRIGRLPMLNRSVSGVSPSGRYVSTIRANSLEAELEDFRYRSIVQMSQFNPGAVAFSADDRWIAFEASLPLAPGGTDTNNARDIYVMPAAAVFDNDRDGLDDGWESFFGLVSTGPHANTDPWNAAGDPDFDGVSNAAELAAGTHPRGSYSRYLAEGSTGPFFDTEIALMNPTPDDLPVLVRFEKSDGTFTTEHVLVPERSRATVVGRAVPGLGASSFATVVEYTTPLFVVDRVMTWDARRYGSHAETSIAAPSTTWFLAEGSTVMGFQLFYLLHNPQTVPATATVRFLLPSGAPIERTYDLAPRSRTTIYVNEIAELASTDVSAAITATQPIVVERSMYRSSARESFALGHAAAGVTAAANDWYLAEGATGEFFDTYVLIANPSASPATVTLDFLREDGTMISKTHTIEPNSRFTVWADSVVGLEATTFGARIHATAPVVVERAMYWAGGFFDYYEGHVSAGSTITSWSWGLAAGEVGGPHQAETYVLIANTLDRPTTISIYARPENPNALKAIEVTERRIDIPPFGRVTVPLSTLAPPNSRAGVRVHEHNPDRNALVVEGAIYWNANGMFWGAGASWPATKVP